MFLINRVELLKLQLIEIAASPLHEYVVARAACSGRTRSDKKWSKLRKFDKFRQKFANAA